MKRNYDCVLLDVDGTIVDSNDSHASAWVKAFAAHGRRVAFDDVRPLMGMGGDKLLKTVAGIDAESPDGKAIAESRATIFQRDYVAGLQPTTGGRELVRRLIAVHYRVIVATSAKDAELRSLLAVADALVLLDDATTSDDAEHSKPDPDIVIAALRQCGCSPDRAVMVGDTPYDIEAARQAGVATIAFRCGGWTDARLSGALAIYDHPADLLERFHDSPLAGEGR